MRTLIRYFLLTATIVGLGWASMTVRIGDRTAVAHLRQPIKDWWAKWSEPSTKESPKKRPAKATKKRTAKKTKDRRPTREIPPAELQSEPEANKRVALLADAAKQARGKSDDSKKPQPTRITPDQKKALDALLSKRQSSQ